MQDLAAGVESVESLLPEIGAWRLRRAGLATSALRSLAVDPELRLYDLLEIRDPASAYSRYRAWLNRLARFNSAVENRAYLSQHD